MQDASERLGVVRLLHADPPEGVDLAVSAEPVLPTLLRDDDVRRALPRSAHSRIGVLHATVELQHRALVREPEVHPPDLPPLVVEGSLQDRPRRADLVQRHSCHGLARRSRARIGELDGGASPITATKWAMAMTNVDLSCVVPISDLAVHWDPTRSKQMFGYIKQDKTADIPKSLCTATGLPKSVTG